MIPGLKQRALNFNDLMMYVAIGRKHLRLMVLLICLTSTAGLTYFVFAKPVYWSRSLVRVDSTYPVPLDDEKVYHDSNFNSIVSQLTSPQMTERVGRRLGLNESARQIEINHIKKVAIKGNFESNLEIEVWGRSVALVRQWAETMVQEFLKQREEKRIQYRDSVIDSFTQEMARISKKLDTTTEEKLDRMAEKEVRDTLAKVSQLRNIPNELLSIKQRIAEMKSVGEKLEDPTLGTVERLSLLATTKAKAQMKVGQIVRQDNPTDTHPGSEGKKENVSPNIIVVPSVMESAEPWEALEKEQRRIQREIDEASLIYLPGHHKLVELRKAMEKVNQGLDSEYDQAKNRFDLELKSVLEQEKEAEAKLPEYQRVMAKSERIERESRLNLGGQLAYNGMYTEMQKQLETLNWIGEKGRVSLQFLDVVELKDRPVSPNRTKIILISILGGLALALGISFLIEYLDHTVSTFEEVESVVQLRGLGIIPQVSSAEQERPVLLDDDNGDRNLVENFRVIRTNLLSVGALSKEPQVIMVTSSMPKEGKTVVSSNLSLSFAQTGARTLILDTDLRRGRLHRLFGLRKSPGLSAVLTGAISLDDALRPTGKEGLTILTAGQHLESGTELLSAPKFAEVMAELRRRFDRIIIDTPPVLGLSETSIVQEHVDGVLFVVWGGRTPMKNITVAIETLQSNGANFYGFILNRLDLTATTNYYHYYYYSNDYYHNYHAIENA